MDLHRHHNNRAAVCHVVPFRLWASRGEPSGSKDLWGFCGPGEARLGTAVAPVRDLRQSPATSRHQVRLGVVTHGDQASSARTARRAQIDAPMLVNGFVWHFLVSFLGFWNGTATGLHCWVTDKTGKGRPV